VVLASVNSFKLFATWRMPSIFLMIGDLHIETFPAGKVAEEIEILGSVSEEPQFDIAAAVPESADLLHLQIALGLQKVNPVTSLVQRTPRVQSERRICINVADTFLMRDVLDPHADAGAIRHDLGPQV